MGWQAAFRPQAWVNDYAIDVDPEGQTRWDLSDAEAHQWLAEAQGSCPDLDALQNHRNAPQWVQDWRGPFYIDLIDPDGLPV